MSTLLYPPETPIWLPSTTHAFLPSTIHSTSQTHFICTTETTQNVQIPITQPPDLRSVPAQPQDDLTLLPLLSNPEVLENLRIKYEQKQIYLYSGLVLIATNPFQRMPELYTKQIIQAYAGKQRNQLEPHVFAVAEEALTEMIRTEKGQSIIISGESGAGKTVSATHLITYFATVESEQQGMDHFGIDNSPEGDHISRMNEVEKQIMATNDILESFGNAKTTRNNNSSRFGKYMELQFNDANKIESAHIKTYLLERSRIVGQPEGERNYHIFYQLIDSAPPAERKHMGLSTKYEDYTYVTPSPSPTSHSFEQTRKALEAVNVTTADQWALFNILAAILHMGNVKLPLTDNDESLKLCTALLEINAADLTKYFKIRKIKIGPETIEKELTPEEMKAARDSVSKWLYSQCFDWVVNRINKGLEGTIHKKSIGVLDIYGFEHFQVNSFEQLCINFANEKLQQEFAEHVFKLEQEEYVHEQIQWSFIDFTDNEACIDLIAGKMSILGMLDEESRLPSGTDVSLASKLQKTFAKHDHFSIPRFDVKVSFGIRHYAHPVVYRTEGMLEKNRDAMPDGLREVLAQGSPMLKELCAQSEVPAGAGTATPAKGGRVVRPTLGNTFKISLQSLIDQLASTTCHYIRCIKPNEEKRAFVFNPPYVLGQLQACGVLETVKISNAGYPSRWGFAEFVHRYHAIAPQKVEQPKDACKSILACLEETKWQIGLTKVFLRAGQVAVLELKRLDALALAASMIQTWIRADLCKRWLVRTFAVRIAIQSTCRAYLMRQKIIGIRENAASVKIQSLWKMHHHRTKYRETIAAVLAIQRGFRAYQYSKDSTAYARLAAAQILQRVYRGYTGRKLAKRHLALITRVQACFRRRNAAREFRKIRREKKDLSTINYKLENKLIALSNTIKAQQNDLEKSKRQESNDDKWKQAYEKAVTKAAETAEYYELQMNEWQSKYNKLESEKNSILKAKAKVIEEAQRKTALIAKLEQQIYSLKQGNHDTPDTSLKVHTESGSRDVHHFTSEGFLGTPTRSLRRTSNASLKTQQTASKARLATLQEIKPKISELDSPAWFKQSIEYTKVEHEVVDVMILDMEVPDGTPDHVVVFSPATAVVKVIRNMVVDVRHDRMGPFITAVLKAVAGKMKFTDIRICAFWIANLYEIYHNLQILSEVVSTSGTAIHMYQQQELSMFESVIDQIGALIGSAYTGWLAAMRTRVNKLAVESLLLHQPIEGCIDSPVSTGGFLRWSVVVAPSEPIEHLITTLKDIDAVITQMRLARELRLQFMGALVRHIIVVAFNDAIMRKNFLSQNRGTQISYNLSVLVEYCMSKDLMSMIDFHVQCITQLGKLLQLPKRTPEDLDFIIENCPLLNLSQIWKFLSLYRVGEFEPPIRSEWLGELTKMKNQYIAAAQEDGSFLLEDRTMFGQMDQVGVSQYGECMLHRVGDDYQMTLDFIAPAGANLDNFKCFMR